MAAWVDLILMANYEDKKVNISGDVLNLKRGQVATSLRYLSSRWGWSKDKVSYFLNTLESDGMITKIYDRNRTVLTLVNYGNYQDLPDKKKTVGRQSADSQQTVDRHPTDSEQTLVGQNKQINKDNKDNKETNIKPLRYFPNDERLETVFQEFLAMRKRMKKKDTEYAIKLLLSKLEKMSPDPDVQAKIIEQSIMNGWIGIFELKDTGKKENRDSLAEKWGII